MITESIITNERVDDIPVLLTQIERMGLQKLIDKNFPTHGNWRGQSLGNVAVIWLTWIIHQSRIKIAERVILQQLRQFCHPNTL